MNNSTAHKMAAALALMLSAALALLTGCAYARLAYHYTIVSNDEAELSKLSFTGIAPGAYIAIDDANTQVMGVDGAPESLVAIEINGKQALLDDYKAASKQIEGISGVASGSVFMSAIDGHIELSFNNIAVSSDMQIRFIFEQSKDFGVANIWSYKISSNDETELAKYIFSNVNVDSLLTIDKSLTQLIRLNGVPVNLKAIEINGKEVNLAGIGEASIQIKGISGVASGNVFIRINEGRVVLSFNSVEASGDIEIRYIFDSSIPIPSYYYKIASNNASELAKYPFSNMNVDALLTINQTQTQLFRLGGVPNNLKSIEINGKSVPLEGVGETLSQIKGISGIVSGNVFIRINDGRVVLSFNNVQASQDVEIRYIFEEIPIGPSKATLKMPDLIEGKAGSEFSAIIGLTNPPDGIRALDGTFNVPEKLSLKSIEALVSGGQLDYWADSAIARFAYVSMSGDQLVFNGEAVFRAVFEVKSALKPDEEIEIAISTLRSVASSSEGAVSYDVSQAKAKAIAIGGGEPIPSARILFTGNGKDLIGNGRAAAAVEFAGLEGSPEISFNGEKLLYSPELSQLGNATYVIMIESAESISDLGSFSSYELGGGDAKEIIFGDANNDSFINSQDALDVIGQWLRKTPEPSNEQTIVENVTADGAIDTVDALAIVEYYVNGTPFEILSK